MRIAVFLGCALLAGLAAYYGEPYIKENPEAISVLITVFTVFAGFLVAIITIVGDPSMIPSGSWRIAEMRHDDIEARLIRHVWLFMAYLISIALLFATVMFHKAPDELVSEPIKVWTARLCLFLGTLSFLLTFSLPGALLKLQMARVRNEIARRRKGAGIKDEDNKTP